MILVPTLALLSKLRSDNTPIYVVILKDAPTLKQRKPKLGTLTDKKISESDGLESYEDVLTQKTPK